MKGILILSHGGIGEETVQTARKLLGNSLEQLDCLRIGEDNEWTLNREAILEKVSELDSGDGVIVLVDFQGGESLSDQLQLKSDCDVITGFNFPLLMEILVSRTYASFSAEELIQKARDGIRCTHGETVN